MLINFYSYLENNDLTWDTFTYSSTASFFIVLMFWTACSALILLLLASPSRNILSNTAFCLLEKRKLFLFGKPKPSLILIFDGRTKEVEEHDGVLDWTGWNIVLAWWMLELILFMKLILTGIRWGPSFEQFMFLRKHVLLQLFSWFAHFRAYTLLTEEEQICFSMESHFCFLLKALKTHLIWRMLYWHKSLSTYR